MADPAPQLFPTQDQQPDARVEEVWDHCEKIGLDRGKIGLTGHRARMLKKGLDAVAGNTEILKRAFDGLMYDRRTKHPHRDRSIDSVLRTRPGGANLSDQIAWWAEQAQTPRDDHWVRQWKMQVVQMLDHPDSRTYREAGERAALSLRQQGITFEHHPNADRGHRVTWTFTVPQDP